MQLTIGIDASRNRSGGAKNHLIGILSNLHVIPHEVKIIHLWSYNKLLDMIPNSPRIIKHTHDNIEKSLPYQLYWQRIQLSDEAKKLGVDIMLNTDAGTVSNFRPCVTMSRDMLSYEKGEMKRYKLSLSYFRLFALKYIQNNSLRNSDASIFLTEYASKIIQKSSGKIEHHRIIPHGIDNKFRLCLDQEKEPFVLNCIYISNIDLYKHQWNVLEAVMQLNIEGYRIKISFVGGGKGKAMKIFQNQLSKYPSLSEKVELYDFLSHDEIREHLKNSHLFVFASSCENMPNTLIEGMASGLPIICSNRGPMPEVLKDGGIYFNPEDIDSIKFAFRTVIQNPDIRDYIRAKSLELSYQYSWENCSRETFQYLVETAKLLKNE